VELGVVPDPRYAHPLAAVEGLHVESFSGGFLCGISHVSGTLSPSRIIAQ
jgi:hypothetical protein